MTDPSITRPSSARSSAAFADSPVCSHCSAKCLCAPREHHCIDDEPDAAIPARVRRKVLRGEYLFRAGEVARSVFAVCSGSLKTRLIYPDGRVQITGFYIPGEVMGLDAYATGAYGADAIAMEAGEICEISLLDLRENDGWVHAAVTAIISQQLVETQEVMRSMLGKKTAASRLAAFLYSMAQRQSRHGLGTENVRLRMSRSEIGDYLGLAKETVSRLFTQLERDRVLNLENRAVHINKLDDLRHVAGCPK